MCGAAAERERERESERKEEKRQSKGSMLKCMLSVITTTTTTRTTRKGNPHNQRLPHLFLLSFLSLLSPPPSLSHRLLLIAPQFGCVALVIIYSSIAMECGGASCGARHNATQ